MPSPVHVKHTGHQRFPGKQLLFRPGNAAEAPGVQLARQHREHENVVIRALSSNQNRQITPEDIPAKIFNITVGQTSPMAAMGKNRPQRSLDADKRQ